MGYGDFLFDSAMLCHRLCFLYVPPSFVGDKLGKAVDDQVSVKSLFLSETG
jgi:hypothetical protein